MKTNFVCTIEIYNNKQNANKDNTYIVFDVFHECDTLRIIHPVHHEVPILFCQSDVIVDVHT